MMDMIQLSVPGKDPQAFPKGTSAKDALLKLGGFRSKEMFAVKVNGVERDLVAAVDEDATLEPLTSTVSR